MIDTPLPPIRRWSDLDGVALTKAEDQLIAAAKAGKPMMFGDTVPTHPTDATLIRAPLLRYLILGGCDACQTQAAGVLVQGAWIADALDLNFATAAGPIRLFDCHIAKEPQMIQLHVPALALNRSTLPHGLNAQGAQVGGDVFLTGVTAKGEVSLSGATITGQLACVGATLENAGGDALNAEGAQVGGGVFLRGVTAKGEVHLSGAAITGQLACVGATLENAGGDALNAQGAQVGGGVFLRGVTAKGRVQLSGAAIAGQLDCEGATLENADGYALQMQRARVAAGFFWRDVKQVSGEIDLNSAHVGDLVDDTASWAKCDRITLVGLTYDVLHGTTDVQERIAWLKKAAQWNGDFHPQPYEQLAKVLRDSGHRAEAREISVQKEIQQRKAVRGQRRKERRWRREFAQTSAKPHAKRLQFLGAKPFGDAPVAFRDRFRLLHPRAENAGFIDPLTLSYAQQDFRNQQRWANTKLRLRNIGSTIVDAVFRFTVGYGYKPQRSLYLLAALIAVGWFMAHMAWHAGDFAPNSDVVLVSADWQTLAMDRDATPNPAAAWSAEFGRGQDYETFQPFYYAVDVVVPIIALGQEAAWTPSTNRGVLGKALFFLNPVLIILGWIVTAIGAAAVTGIIRRD